MAGKKKLSDGLAESILTSTLIAAAPSGLVWLFGPKFLSLGEGERNVVASVVLLVLIFALQGLQKWLKFRLRLPFLKRPARDKLTILVARLEGDDAETQSRTHHVEDSLQDQFGDAVDVFRLPDSIAVDQLGSLAERQSAAAAKGRALLQKRGGDVLVWGRAEPHEKLVELGILAAGRETAPQRYALDGMLRLPEDFGKNLAPALAAAVATASAPAFDSGKYVADVLTPLAARLEGLISAPPAALRGGTWGTVLFFYATVESRIGEQSGNNAALVRGVSAYRKALQEQTRERALLDWAAIQNNLGNALAMLGEREGETARLGEAVAAYREALQEYTRERVPLDWATTENNLGNALAMLGARESGTARLKEAVAAYRAALEERTRERVPLDWAMTQNNLGNALSRLGERESGTAKLEEAVTAFRAALEERTREQVPLDWAKTQDNLGTALMRFGEREGGTARLEEAVAAFRAALEERTRERVPLDWAATQNNLGLALRVLGERESGTASLEAAVAAFRAALAVFQTAKAGYYVNKVSGNLARAEALLNQRQK